MTDVPAISTANEPQYIISEVQVGNSLDISYPWCYSGQLGGIPVNYVPANTPLVPMTYSQYPDESDFGPQAWDPNYPAGSVGFPIPSCYVAEGANCASTPVNSDGNITAPAACPASEVGSGDDHDLFYVSGTGSLFESGDMDGSNPPVGGCGASFYLGSNNMRPAGWTSDDAAGLAVAPLLLKYAEAASPNGIQHPIRMTLHATANYWNWPASHQAGYNSTTYPPMGTWFLLDQSISTAGMSQINANIVKCLQTYGAIIADNGHGFYFIPDCDPNWINYSYSDWNVLYNINASQFYVIDATTVMVNPNSYEALPFPQSNLQYSNGGYLPTLGMPGTGTDVVLDGYTLNKASHHTKSAPRLINK